MTPTPVRQILEDLPTTDQAEALAPWLLNLDQNQDGSLEKSEIQGIDGALRCDFRMEGMGRSAWKNLEKVLLGRSLVGESASVCDLKKGKAPPRLPTASAGLYRSAGHDWIFQLGKGIDLQAVLDFLQAAGFPATATTRKNSFEAVLASGRILRLETGRGTLQKIHYLDADGKPSLLCRMEFWELLRDAGRFDDFFAANPFYDREGVVWQRYYSPVYTFRETPTLSPEQASAKNWQGVLLFPDLHGKWARFRTLEKLVKKEKLDWLALEMLPQNLQTELDDFLSAKESSATWKNAKRKLQNYLQPFWAIYFKKMRDPDANPYYQLLLLCRKRGLKVLALDAPISYTVAADAKHTPLSIGTRNLLWSEKIPAQGRGIVYGGEFHFNGYPKIRVQDFLWERNSKRKIQLVKF